MAKEAKLDPKLKEAYDRVMGISVPAVPKTNVQNAVQTPQPSPPPPQTPAKTSPAPIESVVIAKKSGGVAGRILVVFLIIFLLGYAVFWVKFFKIKIPFLPF